MGQKLQKNLHEKQQFQNIFEDPKMRKLKDKFKKSHLQFSQGIMMDLSKLETKLSQDQFPKHREFHITRKNSGVNGFLLLDGLLIQEILLFLDIKDVVHLQLCNSQYFTLFSFSTPSTNSFLAWNFVLKNFNSSFTIDDDIKLTFLRIIQCIAQDTLSEWDNMYKENLAIKRNWVKLKGANVAKEIMQYLLKPSYQLSHLSEENIQNYANTNFQIKSFQLQNEQNLYEIFIYSAEKIQGIYKQIYFDLRHVQVERIQQAYQQIMNDQLCPNQLKKILQFFKQLIHLCQMYLILLTEALDSINVKEFIILYSICWQHFSNCALQIGIIIQEDLQFLNQLFREDKDENYLSITDIIVKIWTSVTETKEVSQRLVTSFMRVIGKERQDAIDYQLQDSPKNEEQTNFLRSCTESPKNNKPKLRRLSKPQTQIVRNNKVYLYALWNCVKSLIDQSCFSKQVQLLGHPDFKLHANLEQILKETSQNTEKQSNKLFQKVGKDFDVLMNLVEKDLLFLKSIFGDWICENFFEPKHYELMREWLIESVASLILVPKKPITVQQQELLETQFITSQDNLSENQFNEPQKQDLILEGMINYITKQRRTSVQFDSKSSASTRTSDRSNSFTDDFSIQSQELAKSIRSSHSEIAKLENFIARKEKNVTTKIQERKNFIETRSIFLINHPHENLMNNLELVSNNIEKSKTLTNTFIQLAKKNRL